jgi:hypothetical protein
VKAADNKVQLVAEEAVMRIAGEMDCQRDERRRQRQTPKAERMHGFRNIAAVVDAADWAYLLRAGIAHGREGNRSDFKPQKETVLENPVPEPTLVQRF